MPSLFTQREADKGAKIDRIKSLANELAASELVTISEVQDLLWCVWMMQTHAKFIIIDQVTMHPAHKRLIQMIVDAADAMLRNYDPAFYEER